MEMRPRIVLVDGHRAVRQALAGYLEQQAGLDVVGQADRGDDGLALIRAARPDIALVELDPARGDGLELIRRARSEVPGTRCIAFTASRERNAMQSALDAGSAGFVSKDRSLSELVDAIEQARRGRVPVFAMLDASPSRGREAPGLLSPRERQVLLRLAQGHASKEIALQLSISPSTVDGYRRRLSTKLGLSSRAELLQYCLRRGLLRDS